MKLYEDCVKNGLGIAIPNLIKILTSGRYNIPVMSKKADTYRHIGADMGIGAYERMVGNEYRDNNMAKKALEMYERAVRHGDLYACYSIGKFYTYNGIMGTNLKKARDYLEKGIVQYPDDVGFCNLLGEIYFCGGQGLGCDFDKAFALLDKAYNAGNTWKADLLGMCYLKGLGTPVDLDRARTLFKIHPERRLAVAGLKELEIGFLI